MAVNLLTCDNLLEAFKSLLNDLSEEDLAFICEKMNCKESIDSLVSAVEPNMLSVAADGKLLVVPTPSADLVSTEDDNAIAIGADGKLYVKVPDVNAQALISSDFGNIIVAGSDNKLYARIEPTKPAELVSSQVGNDLKIGADGGLYVDVPVAEDLVSKDAGNTVRQGSDGGIFVPMPDASELVNNGLISKDAGNIIEKGSDDGLYAKVDIGDFVSIKQGNQLGMDGENKLYVPATAPSDMISAESGNIITTSAEDGKMTVKTATVQIIVDHYVKENNGELISVEAGNILKQGADGKLYVKPEMEDYVAPGDDNLAKVNGANQIVVDKNVINNMIEAYVPPSGALISKDKGNYTVEGTDGGIYTPTPKAADFLATGDTILRLDENGKAALPQSVIEEIAKGTVTPESLVSLRPGNSLGVDDTNKLFVTAVVTDPNVLISGDEGNTLRAGSDNKLYNPPVTSADLVSKELDNILTTSKVDDKLIIKQQTVVDLVKTESDQIAGDLISEDEGNLIVEGDDSKLKVDQNTIVNLIKNEAAPSALLSKDANNSLGLGSDGGLFYDRGVTWTTTDPGVGSPLPKGHLVFVYEEVLETFTITYDGAGAASGVPAATTAQEDSTYTIPVDAIPTMDGGRFLGWENQGHTYQPGDSFIVGSNVTLTAVWQMLTVITYNGDGADSGVPETATVDRGTEYTIPETVPLKSGFTFAGWSDGTNTYQAGDTFTAGDNVTLVAQWTQNP